MRKSLADYAVPQYRTTRKSLADYAVPQCRTTRKSLADYAVPQCRTTRKPLMGLHRFSPGIGTIPKNPQYGAVPVSTGVWRLDKRAAAPDRHKTGNLKIN